MSPSKFARKTWATLTGFGTVAIVAALAIGMTGWPPATAYAESPPLASDEGVSLSLTAEAAVSAAGVTAQSATVATGTVTEAKQKSLTKAPAKKKAKKKATKAKKAKKATTRVAWRTARVSWYGPGFYGNTMAGGGQLTPSSMVVAHRSLAFGTRIQFRYKGKTCVAVVRDRGPYVSGRTFDLGPGTARALGFGGVGNVQYRILKR